MCVCVEPEGCRRLETIWELRTRLDVRDMLVT